LTDFKFRVVKKKNNITFNGVNYDNMVICKD